ncbi:MAG: hypothetical protein [Bacteriophage sp.]|nr:MAG: hypothetical protein [Bacteriophage sp.]
MVRLIKKDNGNYTNTSNQLVRDASLTWKARGIFNYLWSQANEWQFYVSEVAQHSKDGENALQTGLQELEEHVYQKRINRHSKKGKFDGLDWILDDMGSLNRQAENTVNGEMQEKKPKKAEKPSDVKTAGREKRQTENRRLRNNNNKNYQYKEITKESNKANDQSLEDRFEKIWAEYPRKQGKKDALRHYKAWIKASSKHTDEYLMDRLEKYKAYLKANNTELRYVQKGSTWFNGSFDDDWSIKPNRNYNNYSQPAELPPEAFDTSRLNVNEEDLPF